MAFSINKFSGLGNIGQDLELREAGDSHVLNFSIACNERFKKRGEDNYTDKTEWIRLVAWGKVAELIAEHAHKGSKLYVEGPLQTRKWEKDGVAQYTTEINVREFVILDGRTNSKSDNGDQKEEDDYPF